MSEAPDPRAIVNRMTRALGSGDNDAALEAAREGYELYNLGGIDAWIEIFTEDVVWSEGTDVPEPEIFRGRDGVVRQQRAFAEAWDAVRVTPQSVRGDGEHAVVVLDLWARGKGSGAEVEARVAHLWQISDGLISRMEVYLDPAAALAAAGL
jgi:ketosteroid isomerase-like protein